MRHVPHPPLPALLASVFVALLATAHGQNDVPASDVPATAIDRFLEARLADSALPGVAVAVVGPDAVLYARGFGRTALDGGAPIDPDTPFEIGSLVKSMTSLALLRLETEGRVDLDAPVRDVLPWFRLADEAASARITPRHLLSHTSGIPANAHGVLWRDPERIGGSIEEAVRALATVEPRRAPGEGFEYANMGYVVLGAVVEAATGEPWGAHVEERVTVPLAMARTDLVVDDWSGYAGAEPHAWRLGRIAPAEHVRPFASPAGSTAVASGRDMARYLQAWLDPDGHAAMPPNAEAAFEPIVPSGGGESYGMGWGSAERHGERIIYHTGGTAGSTSYMSLLPERGLGVVVLANALSGVPAALGAGVNDLLLGADPAPPAPDVQAVTSRVLAGVAAASLVLLAWLAARCVGVARRGWTRRGALVQGVRAVALVAVTVAVASGLRTLVPAIGLPAAFGWRGYPLDWLVALLGVGLATLGWAAYGLLAFAFGRRRRDAVKQRVPVRGTSGGARAG